MGLIFMQRNELELWKGPLDMVTWLNLGRCGSGVKISNSGWSTQDLANAFPQML